jgi:hypothetical protein
MSMDGGDAVPLASALGDTSVMDSPASAYRREVSGLSPETRTLLANGAEYWSDEGPAGPDHEVLLLMGLNDWRAARRRFGELSRRLHAGTAISVLDLTRILLLTEIGISSAVLGPTDWYNLFGRTTDPDADAIEDFKTLLRAQAELATARVPASGTNPFGKHPLPE